ncbi:MAG TPA: LON peptidase substrate-binding domain-containing protein [Candidatus Didemnitutus sp.]|jgi:ATP-dependent Lon protease
MESLKVPKVLPVMTLPRTVFFPQSLLPLHIFEPRYREMLRDVLASDRLFAVARLDPAEAAKSGAPEPPHRIATVGIIRACQKAEEDASNLLLQGLTRVEICGIVREKPYRMISVRTLATRAGGTQQDLDAIRVDVMRLLNVRRRLGAPAPKGITQFLDSIEDIDAFVDVAAFNLCEDDAVKQRLLEELDTNRRLVLLARQLKGEIEIQRLRRKLQGRLPDDGIINN